MTGVVVAGMHRSGTSVTARMLGAGGWHPGEVTLAGDGELYEEDARFVEVNRRWLAETLPDGEGHVDWGISGGGLVDLDLSSRTDARRRLHDARAFVALRNRQRRRWMAKDPRATLFLPVWGRIRSLRFVLVYRSPWDVVDSAVRLGSENFCRHPDLVRRAWVDHNRRILEFVTGNRDRCLVLASEVLTSDPNRAWSALSDFVGMEGEPPGELVDPTRYRVHDEEDPVAIVYRQLYPDDARILDALDLIADLPRSSSSTSGSRPARAAPGGTLPAGTGVQIIMSCRDDGEFLVRAIASADMAAADARRRKGHEEVELTIVDDGSTDPETLRIMDRLRADGRHVLRTPGVGLSAARNLAASASRTAAVLPLDADNRLHSPLVAALDAVVADEVDIVHGSWRRFGMDDSIVRPPEMTARSLLPDNSIDACALISRRLLENLGGWDEALPFWEDWDLWLGAVGVGARVRRLDAITFDYLVRPGSLSSRATDLHQRDTVIRHVACKHPALFDSAMPTAGSLS